MVLCSRRGKFIASPLRPSFPPSFQLIPSLSFLPAPVPRLRAHAGRRRLSGPGSFCPTGAGWTRTRPRTACLYPGERLRCFSCQEEAVVPSPASIALSSCSLCLPCRLNPLTLAPLSRLIISTRALTRSPLSGRTRATTPTRISSSRLSSTRPMRPTCGRPAPLPRGTSSFFLQGTTGPPATARQVWTRTLDLALGRVIGLATSGSRPTIF